MAAPRTAITLHSNGHLTVETGSSFIVVELSTAELRDMAVAMLRQADIIENRTVAAAGPLATAVPAGSA